MSHELQAPKIADTWPSENVWVIMQQDPEQQKLQNIEESRAGTGAAYSRTCKIQTIHDDVHQLLEADFFWLPHLGSMQGHHNHILNADH